MTMNSVYEMNGAAIALLDQGQLDASLSMFHGALEVARNKCSNEQQPSSTSSEPGSESRQSCQLKESPRYNVDVLRLHDNIHLRPRLIQNSGDIFLSNDFEVFQAVFQVSRQPRGRGRQQQQQQLQQLQQQLFQELEPTKDGETEDTVEDVEVLVLLYNFAFTLHMAGLTSPDANRRERALRKALQVYHMANTCARSITLEEHPEFCTLLLALAANQGHIHSFFFHQEEVQSLHDKIVSFLTLTNETAMLLLGQDYFFFEGVAVCSGFAKSKLPPMA